MLEILKFIFSSFWIWLGTVILCSVIFGGLGSMFTHVTQIIKKDKNDKGED